MFGGNRNQSSNEDRPVVIDGRTGRVIDTDRNDQSQTTDRGGGQDRGSAQWTYDEYGRPTPYTPGQEW